MDKIQTSFFIRNFVWPRKDLYNGDMLSTERNPTMPANANASPLLYASALDALLQKPLALALAPKTASAKISQAESDALVKKYLEANSVITERILHFQDKALMFYATPAGFSCETTMTRSIFQDLQSTASWVTPYVAGLVSASDRAVSDDFTFLKGVMVQMYAWDSDPILQGNTIKTGVSGSMQSAGVKTEAGFKVPPYVPFFHASAGVHADLSANTSDNTQKSVANNQNIGGLERQTVRNLAALYALQETGVVRKGWVDDLIQISEQSRLYHANKGEVTNHFVNHAAGFIDAFNHMLMDNISIKGFLSATAARHIAAAASSNAPDPASKFWNSLMTYAKSDFKGAERSQCTRFACQTDDMEVQMAYAAMELQDITRETAKASQEMAHHILEEANTNERIIIGRIGGLLANDDNVRRYQQENLHGQTLQLTGLSVSPLLDRQHAYNECLISVHSLNSGSNIIIRTPLIDLQEVFPAAKDFLSPQQQDNLNFLAVKPGQWQNLMQYIEGINHTIMVDEANDIGHFLHEDQGTVRIATQRMLSAPGANDAPDMAAEVMRL